GARVTLVETLPRLLAREDPEVSESMRAQLVAEGIDVRTGYRAVRIDPGPTLVCEHAGGEARFEFDRLLCALGRVPNTAGYGLEELGIPVTKARTVETDEYLQTLYPNIYACGDVAGHLIVEDIAAMNDGIRLNKILGTIHIYPTLAEANKYAAGSWKRAHAPEALLRQVERFHAWRRG